MRLKNGCSLLVGVDFSQASLHALKFAIKTANFFNGSISLIWVNNKISREEFGGALKKMVTEEASDKLAELRASFLPTLISGKMDYKIREGEVSTELANQAKYSDIDLVVCSTHGKSQHIQIGNNAYKIVEQVNTCPILSIHPSFERSAEHGLNFVKKMVLPIDSSQETRQKTSIAVDIALASKAEIHILNLYSSRISSLEQKVNQYSEQVAKYITDKGLPYQVSKVYADNNALSVTKYAQEIQADLIVMMKEQEVAIKNFVLGSYAKQLVEQSPIPLISLPTQDIHAHGSYSF